MVEFIDSCRICLESRGEFISIDCESDSPNTSYLDAYNFCTGLSADLNDSLPNIICQDCATNLIFAFHIIQKAIRSNELLMSIIKKGHNSNQDEEAEDHQGEKLPPEDPGEEPNQLLYEEEIDLVIEEERHNDHDSDIDLKPLEFEYECEPSDCTKKAEENEYSQDSIERLGYSAESYNDSLQRSEDLSQHSRDHFENLEVALPQKDDQLSVPKKPVKPSSRRTWCCEICGKIFATKQKLGQHNLVHTKEKNYECTLCPKRFATIYRYRDHMNTHKNIRNFYCEFCQQSFSSKSTLICHIRRHTGERPYKCKICGKAFTQASIMKTHAALHTGKTVECELCSKKFSRPSHLILHQRSHTGERPYLCIHCPNRYKQKSHLDRHLDTHLGIKHTCEVCGKSYTKKSSLNHHKFVHLATKPFNCEQCKLEFATKDKYNRHLKNVHKSPPKDPLPKDDFL